jgi:valyl-tRNA synthetase
VPLARSLPGLNFRGNRLVDWGHAAAKQRPDNTKGAVWTFMYPVKPNEPEALATEPVANAFGSLEFVRFSTTHPETMLGDTVVCAHPRSATST